MTQSGILASNWAEEDTHMNLREWEGGEDRRLITLMKTNRITKYIKGNGRRFYH